MIIILLEWGLFYLVFWTIGHLVCNYFNFCNASIAEKIIIGLVTVCLDQVLWSWFFPTASLGLLFLLIISGLLLIIYRKLFVYELRQVKSVFNSLWILLIISITAWISAQKPTLFDHQSYYIPTMQWFADYGMVKGLANLHPFFAQSSAWHILQSTFSNFGTSYFLDDLNGFVLLIGVLYFLEKKPTGFFQFYSFIAPLMWLFIDSASTDLPILIFTPIILHASYTKQFNLIHAIIIVFLVFIKITTAPLLLILIMHLEVLKKHTFWMISAFMCTLWLLKNYLISGWLLYPFTLDILNPEWQMSKTIMNITSHAGYGYEAMITKNLNLFQKLNLWWHQGGVDGFFNQSIVFMFLTIPFLKAFKHHGVKKVYLVFLVTFGLLLLTAPQFRFFLSIWLFFGVLIIDQFIKFTVLKSKILFSIMFFPAIFIILFNPNQLILRSNLSATKLLVPYSESFKTSQYIKIYSNQFTYYSPVNQSNFFLVGYLPLPSSNKAMLDYFKTYYYIVPKPINNHDISKGFKHIKLKE